MRYREFVELSVEEWDAIQRKLDRLDWLEVEWAKQQEFNRQYLAMPSNLPAWLEIGRMIDEGVKP